MTRSVLVVRSHAEHGNEQSGEETRRDASRLTSTDNFPYSNPCSHAPRGNTTSTRSAAKDTMALNRYKIYDDGYPHICTH